MDSFKKAIDQHLHQEINKFLGNLTYHTVNKMIDYYKSEHGQFIDIELVELKKIDVKTSEVRIIIKHGL